MTDARGHTPTKCQCGGEARLFAVEMRTVSDAGPAVSYVYITDCLDCDHATCPNCRASVESYTSRVCATCGSAILLRRV